MNLAGMTDEGRARVASIVADEVMVEAVMSGLPAAVAKVRKRRRARIQIDFLREATPFYRRAKSRMAALYGGMESDVLKNMGSTRSSTSDRKTAAAMYVLHKEKFDVAQWLFNRQKWRGTIADGIKQMDGASLQHFGNAFLEEVRDIGVSARFDMLDPRVIEFLATNAKKAGWKITDTAYEKVREVLMNAVADGLSIPKIAAKVRELFDGMKKFEAERIARTETLRASNRGLYEGMIQSNVVEGVQWISTADARTCAQCADMEGKTMGLGKPFFEEGSSHTWSDGSTSVFDYEEILSPPLHPLCRCTLLAIVRPVQSRGIVPGFLPRFVIIQNVPAWA